MKSETMRAIRDFRDLVNQVQGELNKIDPGLKDSVRTEREAQIWEKYGKHLSALREKIRQGREHFQGLRLREADPLTALLRKAWQANDDKPGLSAVCEALELMGPEQQLEIAKEFNHPALALKAVTNIRRMDIDPESRMKLDSKVQDLTRGYVSKDMIREYASIEKECLEAEVLQNKTFGGSAQDRAALGYNLESLKRVIASGEIPDSELQQAALDEPDPQARMNAARQ